MCCESNASDTLRRLLFNFEFDAIRWATSGWRREDNDFDRTSLGCILRCQLSRAYQLRCPAIAWQRAVAFGHFNTRRLFKACMVNVGTISGNQFLFNYFCVDL